MVEKISSLDDGYVAGDLSIYPEAVDDRADLHIVTNNAQTTLKQTLSFTGSRIIVNDASSFPQQGLLRIGTEPGVPGSYELIWYDSRTNGVFSDLHRGFAKSRQNRWSIGSPVIHGVMAEHHNTLRDALLNIETNLGVEEQPVEGSLNYILQSLEEKWLAPRAIFRANPVVGPPPLKVTFHNFTLGHSLRFLWDFGDGTTSTDRSPNHTYLTEGHYTVRLDVVTELGGTGITTKAAYIIVDEEQIKPFFYVVPKDGGPKAYSIETATELGVSPTTFSFVDQTDGDIMQRYWAFGDGEKDVELDPNIHTIEHIYQQPGTYEPSLLVVFESTLGKRGVLTEQIVVL